ncbi:MAG: hypothetical protein GY861_12100 [bacterium]|nr:hypothetical protein [bacterium]
MNNLEVKSAAMQNLESIAQELLPNGKKNSNSWTCGSISGEDGKSLSVCLSGQHAGGFTDFSTGEKGDMIKLWELVRGVSYVDALNQLGKFLGVREDMPVKKAIPYVKPNQNGLKKREDSHPVTAYLRDKRGITEKTQEALKIATCDHKMHGATIVFPTFDPDEDKLTKLKYLAVERKKGKKITWVSKDAQEHLWGWHTITDNDRYVILFEGELDMATSYQWGFPSLSLPMGSNGTAWIENDYEHLGRFEKIYLCFDSDDAGEKAFETMSNRLGKERCFKVKLPKKDLNEMLLEGGTKEEFQTCLDEAKTIDPKQVVRAEEYMDKLRDKFYSNTHKTQGSACPWNIPWRIRPRELTLWTGINSHGKSVALSQCMVNDMAQGNICCCASMEMPVDNQLEIAVRQALGMEPHQNNHLDYAMEFINPRLLFINYEDEINHKEIIKQFIYTNKRYGCNRFVVDSLLYCVNTEDLKDQKAVVRDFRKFAMDYEVHVHLVAHSRKGADEDKAPGKMDISGSGDISNIADNGITIWRNKPKERGLESKYEGDGTFYMWKQRETGIEPFIQLYFKRKAKVFVESESTNPIKYVNTELKQEEIKDEQENYF